RNENDGKPIPALIPEPVLQRRKHKERPEERAMVSARGADKAYVFAQRQQRDEGKQQHGTCRPDQEGDGEDPNHDPPHAYARVQIVDRLSAFFRLYGAGENESDQAGHHQPADDKVEDQKHLMIKFEVHTSLRAQTAACALVRKDSLVSFSSSRSGAPKVTRLITGTGKNSPLGRIRFRF